MSVRVFAPAKINLTLEVGPPRADGLHPLQSVVMFADVGDVVEAEVADVLSLEISGEFAGDLEADGSNLVLRAARALADAAGIASPGARLHLEKNLPIASGIGGGSADAAATLRALNALWSLDWPQCDLTRIAQTLGADVPVCLAATPAFMSGAGEIFEPLSIPTFSVVLANPLKPLATPDVYRQFDIMQLGADFAVKPAPEWPDQAQALSAIAAVGNDLRAPASAMMPEIEAMMALLRGDARAKYVGLSGSGATVFAIVNSPADAEMLADAVQQLRPDWWVTDAVLAGA